jgi:hypothetical protein
LSEVDHKTKFNGTVAALALDLFQGRRAVQFGLTQTE